MYFVQKTREIQCNRYFSSFRDFSGGFECVLLQMLLIQTLFSEGMLSYPLSCDMIIFVCRENRFRVMVDIVRDPNKIQIL